jgi:hypothetical protein
MTREYDDYLRDMREWSMAGLCYTLITYAQDWSRS